MAELSEILGFPGAYGALRALQRSVASELTQTEVKRLMREHGVSHPDAALTEFLASNVLRQNGTMLCLTDLGVRTALLLEAINHGDLRGVYRRLLHLGTTPNTYELVEEGMTKAFLRSLTYRPGFGRLYFCSPWINLDHQERHMLQRAVAAVERRRGRRPEVLVVARPREGTRRGVPATLRPFETLGASIFLHSRLHTKLYIRDPDSSGGYAMAILGSENLTRSRYLELGIRINCDGRMINRLIAYFLRLTNQCYEIRKGGSK